MNAVAIIQARVGSTRLPRKVLAELSGKTVLEHVIERVKTAATVNQVVVAVPDTEQDKQLAAIAEKSGASFFAGPEQDVLLRFVQAAKQFSADVIVRVGADLPLISVRGIDQAVKRHLEKGADYTFNKSEMKNPNGYPGGSGVEIISRPVLEKVNSLGPSDEEREHVTLFIRRNPENFKIEMISAPAGLSGTKVRLCIDTKEDFEVVEAIFNALYSQGKIISTQEAVQFLKGRPEIAEKNVHIEDAVGE